MGAGRPGWLDGVVRRAEVTLVNAPSTPGTFVAPYRIEIAIDFDDRDDDYRRIMAENWCCHHTRRRWFRRVLTERGIVVFEFEDAVEAVVFKLAN
jgi:hypothetical protein